MTYAPIELIARAVLETTDGRIVLCRVRGADWFFLPGGHVELQETAKNALCRELIEELGLKKVDVTSFLGVIENFYSLGEQPKHEVNLIFKVRALEDLAESKEEKIEFNIFSREKLRDLKIFPLGIKDVILSAGDFKHNLL